MGNINVDPCRALNEKAEEKILSLESLKDILEPTLNRISTDIQGYGVATDPNTLTNIINSASADTIKAGSSQLSVITNFTGSCLDSVINKAISVLENITSEISDAISDYFSGLGLGETSVSKDLRDFTGSVNSMNFSGIIGEIDRILGCMSDQPHLSNCLNQLTSFSNRVNSVTSALYLTDNGLFNQSNFLDNVPGIDSQLKSNLESITNKMDEIETEAVNNINEAVDSALAGTKKLTTPNNFV